jgi:hypothetical protein
MAWTVPVTQPTGVLITAAIWNAQVSGNHAYLHGDAGTITYTGPTTLMTSAGDLLLTSTSGTVRTVAGALLCDASNGLMRVHRHPYANARHIESGVSSLAPGAAVVVTFTDAFAAAPAVTVSAAFAGATGTSYASMDTVTTTSVRIINSHASSTLAIHWHAEGQD